MISARKRCVPCRFKWSGSSLDTAPSLVWDPRWSRRHFEYCTYTKFTVTACPIGLRDQVCIGLNWSGAQSEWSGLKCSLLEVRPDFSLLFFSRLAVHTSGTRRPTAPSYCKQETDLRPCLKLELQCYAARLFVEVVRKRSTVETRTRHECSKRRRFGAEIERRPCWR